MINDADACPFCQFALPGIARPLLATTDHVAAFEDAYPSAVGHVLVVPRRHVGRIIELTDEEFHDLWYVAREQMRRLEKSSPDAYTIGVNDGEAAGQTIAHVHLHVVPRRFGDTADPRGGVRWAVPETAAYWEKLPD
jgi:diadenosine tetraphosphate (Ap4A) HIT family hydrolase